MVALNKVSTLDLISELVSRQNVEHKIIEEHLVTSLHLYDQHHQILAQNELTEGPGIIIACAGIRTQDLYKAVA